MPGRRAAAGLLLVLVGSALGSTLGCGRSAEAAEAERVLAAIDALRDAPAADTRRRRGLLERLEQQAAIAPAAVGARDGCAAAYRRLLDGDDLATGVRLAVERGQGARPEVPRQLQEAEADVAQARILMTGCERALAGLRHPGAGGPLP